MTLATPAVTDGIPSRTWLSAGILIPFAFLGGLAGRPLGDRLGADAFAILPSFCSGPPGSTPSPRRPRSLSPSRDMAMRNSDAPGKTVYY